MTHFDYETRRVAATILTKTEDEKVFISELLASGRRREGVEPKFLEKLVKGTITNRSSIDAALEKIGTHDIRKLETFRLNLIRLAVYQLGFFSKVDPKRVLSETAALMKTTEKKPAKKGAPVRGFGHFATLIERAAHVVQQGDQDSEVGAGHPGWLVRRWEAEWGKSETAAFCRANNQPWPVAVRTNLLRCRTEELIRELKRAGVQVRQGEWAVDSVTLLRLPRNQSLMDLDPLAEGLCQVQDESATLVGLIANPQPGELVYDLCAAPGTKSTHLAMLMRDRGKIIALDKNVARLKRLRESCAALSLRSISIKSVDALTFRPKQLADLVLLDAPCSGFGVLGRKTDVRWQRSEADLEALYPLQKKLITHGLSLVRPGGRLVYSTCTIESAENEAVIAAALQKRRDFSVFSLRGILPDALVTPEGYFRSWPHRHHIGGAFAAVLQRKE